MPRVPKANVQTGPIPFTSQGSPESILQTAQVAARTTAIASSALSQFAIRRNQQRAREEANNAISSFSRGLDEMDAEISRSDDITAMSATFEARSGKLNIDTGAGIQSRSAQRAFFESSQRLITSHGARINKVQFAREQEAGRIDLTNNLDDLTSSIIVAPDEVIREELIETGTTMIQESDLLLSEQKGPAVEAFLKQIDVKTIRSLIDMADASEQEVEAISHLDTALDFLKDPEDTPSLSSQERTQMRREVQAERDEAVQRFNVGTVRDLNGDIATSSLAEEPALTARISSLLDEGVINDTKASQMDAALRQRQQFVRSADSGALGVEMARQFGIPIDPKDRDAVDAYFVEIFLPDLAGKTADEVQDEIVQLVEDIDVLPRQVEKGLRTAANSDNPQIVAQAAEQFIALSEASPQAMDVVSDPTAIFLENMNESVLLNVPVGEALTNAREIAKLTPAVRKGRSQDYTFQQQEETDSEWLMGNKGEFRIRRPFAWDPSADEIDPGLRAMFAATVSRMHLLDPTDIDKSRDRALDRMARVVGTTEVGGEMRNMYLAPELMYPGFNGDSGEITTQLVEDMRSLELPELAGVEDLGERLILAADADSLREFDPVTEALTPGYTVYLRDGLEGAPLLLLDNNNIPIRFWPDDQRALKRERAQKLLEAQEVQRGIEKTFLTTQEFTGEEEI